MTISRSTFGLAIAALMLLGSACDNTQSEAKRDAGAAQDAGRKNNVLDPLVQKTIDSAAAAENAAPASANEAPPGGVFGPGLGDKAHPVGAPLELTLISAGSDPKVSLKPVLAIDKPLLLRIKPVKRTGRTQTPGIIYTLSITTRSADDGKKKADKPKGDTASAPATPGPVTLVAVVKAVENTDKDKVPQKLDEQINKLVGSRIVAELTASGTIANAQTTVAKKATEIGDLLASLAESLELALSPAPSQPVGVGASWMARDRTKIGGMDLIRYRSTEVVKIAGDNFAFKVNIRHYAASESAVPSSLDPAAGLIIAKLDSLGNATFTRTAGQLLPSSGKIQLPLIAQLGSPKQQAAGGVMQQVLISEIVPPAPKEKK